MNNKNVFIIALIMLATSFINAQESTGFKFSKLVHDFGKIKEENGKATYKFKFTNKGKKPIVIKNVTSTCGCTSPEWTRTPVLPGKTGFVSAEYNPLNRPGSFDKQIKIFSNVSSTPIVLSIKGVVIQKTKQIEDIYRYQLGSIRLKAKHLAFARITNTEVKTQTVEFINNSNKNVSISVNKKKMPAYLRVNISPSNVAPKQKGTITIEYNAKEQKNVWGYRVSRIPLVIDGKALQGYPLSVSATIVEDFSKLTKEELENAPTMDFETTTYDFGKVKSGTKITHEYKFKNNGKRDLIIRNTRASCGCTAVQTKKIIKPGESSSIKVVFNTTGKRSRQHKTITIISKIPGKHQNGGEKAKTILRIKGEVTN